MESQLTSVFKSEAAALDELKQRLKAGGRSPTLVLSGPKESRFATVLKSLADDLAGEYCDLGSATSLDALQQEPPLYGRNIHGRLSDTVLRQFLMRAAGKASTNLLTIHVPAMIWTAMVVSDADSPQRFLGGLREWASPCPVVVSYPLGAHPSLPNAGDLSQLLGRHLVELTLTDAQRRYLEEG